MRKKSFTQRVPKLFAIAFGVLLCIAALANAEALTAQTAGDGLHPSVNRRAAKTATVAPESSTWAMIGAGFTTLILLQRTRGSGSRFP
jgi:hypothetical protein